MDHGFKAMHAMTDGIGGISSVKYNIVQLSIQIRASTKTTAFLTPITGVLALLSGGDNNKYEFSAVTEWRTNKCQINNRNKGICDRNLPGSFEVFEDPNHGGDDGVNSILSSSFSHWDSLSCCR